MIFAKAEERSQKGGGGNKQKNNIPLKMHGG